MTSPKKYWSFANDGAGLDEIFERWITGLAQQCARMWPSDPSGLGGVRRFFFSFGQFDGIPRNMAPVTPSEFAAQLGSESDPICDRLIALQKLQVLWFKLVRWMINEDGTDFSDAFKAELCAVECVEEEAPVTLA